MPFFRKDDQIFEPTTRLEKLMFAPLKYFISIIYLLSSYLRSVPTPQDPPIRVVCVSDTHTLEYADIPDGDLLIHAGDLTNAGTVAELQKAIDWLASFPHQYKVAIAGNHDTYLDPRSRKTLSEAGKTGSLDWRDIHYLQHDSISLAFVKDNKVRKLAIYGAPNIPACGGSEFAFQYPRGQDAFSGTIPKATDILITHTPPKYHRDSFNPSLGCEHLLAEVWKVKPRLHVFGHVHVGAGKEIVWWDSAQHAYESSLARNARSSVAQAFDIPLWLELAKVVLHGFSEVVWDRVWGGETRSTIMVNAALMKNNTGRLGNPVQVVEI